jgi:hypothetical protein
VIESAGRHRYCSENLCQCLILDVSELQPDKRSGNGERDEISFRRVEMLLYSALMTQRRSDLVPTDLQLDLLRVDTFPERKGAYGRHSRAGMSFPPFPLARRHDSFHLMGGGTFSLIP